MNNENLLATRFLRRRGQPQPHYNRFQTRQFPNRTYYINKLITEYLMSPSNAIEYFDQLYHFYITYNPNCPFNEFLDVIMRIFYN